MAPEPLTLVVPLRLGPRADAARARLASLLESLPAGVGAIVSDDTPDLAERARTAALAEAWGARHLAVPSTAAPFSIGRLRDAGTEAAPEGWVMFHDVDFRAPPDTYARLRDRLCRPPFDAPEAFACAPVRFLTRLGTALHPRLASPSWPLTDRLVRGSSAIVARRARLRALGGHDPAFEGHGAEDFDLLHRLSEGFPAGPRPADYARDHGSRHRGPGGFRAYFGRYAEPLLAEGVVLVHLWHPRRTEDARYYAARRRNFALLEARLSAHSHVP